MVHLCRFLLSLTFFTLYSTEIIVIPLIFHKSQRHTRKVKSGGKCTQKSQVLYVLEGKFENSNKKQTKSTAFETTLNAALLSLQVNHEGIMLH